MHCRSRKLAAGLVAAVALAAAAQVTTSPSAAAGPQPHMRGGGWVALGGPDTKVHFTLDLACSGEGSAPNRLDIRWGDNRFRLDEVRESECSLGGPDTKGGTHEGSGVGTCGGERGIIIWTFEDSGEGSSGRGDTADVTLPPGPCNVSFGGPLGGGNIQMLGGPDT